MTLNGGTIGPSTLWTIRVLHVWKRRPPITSNTPRTRSLSARHGSHHARTAQGHLERARCYASCSDICLSATNHSSIHENLYQSELSVCHQLAESRDFRRGELQSTSKTLAETRVAAAVLLSTLVVICCAALTCCSEKHLACVCCYRCHWIPLLRPPTIQLDYMTSLALWR